MFRPAGIADDGPQSGIGLGLLTLVVGNVSVGGVIVNRLKVFSFDAIRQHAGFVVQSGGYITHEVLHKLRMIVCIFGHILFI